MSPSTSNSSKVMDSGKTTRNWFQTDRIASNFEFVFMLAVCWYISLVLSVFLHLCNFLLLLCLSLYVFIHCFVAILFFFSFFLTEKKKIWDSFLIHKSLSIQELLPMSTRLYDCYNFPPCCSLEHLSRAQLKWRCFGENWRHQSSGSSSFCLLWLAVTSGMLGLLPVVFIA